MADLPIIETTLAAGKGTAARRRDLWRCLELPVLCGILAATAIALAFGDGLQDAVQDRVQPILNDLASAQRDPAVAAGLTDADAVARWSTLVIQILIAVVVAEIASFWACFHWHRTFLDGSAGDRGFGRYAGYRLLLSWVFPTIGGQVLGIVSLFGTVGALASLTGQVALGMVLLRLSLALPAAGAGRPLSLSQAWRLGENATLSIVIVHFLIALPGAILIWLVGQIVIGLSQMMTWPETSQILVMGGFVILLMLWHALTASALAACYRRLMASAPPGVMTNRKA